MATQRHDSGCLYDSMTLPDVDLLQRLPPISLALLLRAVRYAGNAGRPTWDFAPTLDELRRHGLSLCDLRWLTDRGLLLHARETSQPHGTRRTFDHRQSVHFSEESAFALTSRGVELLQDVLDDPLVAGSDPPQENEDKFIGEAANSRVPSWDRELRELRIGRLVIKRFRVPARNQERILSAFEEEAWPIHIDDPLPPVPQIEPKRRLHSAIQCLNRNQKARLLQFHGDGEGLGIRWELLTGP